ncbi:hypothetical protein EVAR_61506_1 [Eumeta japonica]|uniref:Uncharacterized protein n=1 Tax=Eumeta variegata TaxID=151549 RepID=A0A4C2A6S1_EUMVA|nr:hypothetical protein EVAR_61506_1 [Eumeta japonica]
MRTTTGSPWYVRNLNLHKILGLQIIAALLNRLSKRYFGSSVNYSDSLTVVAACNNFCARAFSSQKCRPKHVLSDPDDSITFAIAKSSFSPQKNTPGHYHKLCDPVIPDRAYSVIRNFCQVQRSSTSDLHFQTPNTEVTRAA